MTWRNELPPGVESINGVPVRRFRVKRERDPRLFGRRSDRVFEQPHSLGDELDWLDAEGPTSPALIDYITRHGERVRLLPVLQLPLLPRVLRRPRGRAARHSRPDGRARRGDRLDDVPIDFPGRARRDVQLARRADDDPGRVGQSRRPRRRGRHRIGHRPESAARPLSAEVQHPRAVCGLRRPHRQEQGVPRAVRVLPGLPPRPVRQAVARADWQFHLAGSGPPADPSPRICRRHGQVRRHGGGRPADHAVVLREPVDGGPGSVGHGPSGAVERQVRRPEGPVDSQQRRLVLRDLLRVSRDAARARAQPLAECRRWAETAGSSFASTTTGRSSSGSTSTCSNGCRSSRRASRWTRFRAGSNAGVRTCRRPNRCWPACRRALARRSSRRASRARHRPAAQRACRTGGQGRSARRQPATGRPAAARALRITGAGTTGRAGAAVLPDDPDPPGPGDARLRRRHRARSPRYSARPARAGLRVGDLRRDRRLPAGAVDPRLSGTGRRQPPRQSGAPSFFARVEGVPDRLRAAGSDGAHLPQHHAAGVFHRRASHARTAVLSRAARAARLRRPLRPRAWRLGVQPPGPRESRVPAHGGAAGDSRLLQSRPAAEPR